MSAQLINRSADLKRLRDEGYDLCIVGGHLLIKDVPYVNTSREVRRGTLVSKLMLAGDVTTKPDTHVAYFVGECPCDQTGRTLSKIINSSTPAALDRDLMVDHTFSAKPKPDDFYPDYYQKITAYVAILSGPAQAIDPTVTAQTFPTIEAQAEESVFNYIDTASSRAGIAAVTRRLEVGKVAIVGLGGTGSYVLDLIAKTPIREIHLFDGDVYSQHNAFRSPGAAAIEDLKRKPFKVHYFRDLYSRMHRNIIAHPVRIDSSNIAELKEVSFVFLCMDAGGAKRLIVAALCEAGIPFIDVGMGIGLVDDSLIGIVRTTTSSKGKSDHLGRRISFSDGDVANEYDTNIQVADLNALNAALAVIKWKKLLGFYLDLDQECHSTYTIDGNALLNEDRE